MKFKKIFFHYAFRYFMGFLVVFMCSILIASVADKSIENYIIEEGILKNQGGIDHIYENVTKMDLISQLMAKNPSYTSLMYQSGQALQSEVMKLKEANKMLVDIGFTADYIPYVFTLFKNNDMYISTSQCSLQFEQYYNRFLSCGKEGMDLSAAEKFKNMLWERYKLNEPFIKLDRISYIYGNKEHILNDAILYITAGDYKGLQPTSLFCFVIDSSSLVDNIMIREKDDRGFLTIRNTKTGEELLRYGSVPEGEEECGNGQELGDDETYRTIVKIQEDLNWRIVTGVPMSYIKEQMAPVGEMLFTYLLTGLLLTVGFTLYYSMRRYSGVRKVLFALPFGSIPEWGKAGFDEYSILTDNILELEDSGKRYRLRVEELEKENRAILLEHLIVMGIRSPEERSVFETCFKKEPEFFCVALVRLYQEDYREFGKITLFFTEYLNRRYKDGFAHVYSGVSDELFLFELNLKQEACVDGIKAVLEEAAAVLTTRYNVMFHIGISAIGTDLSNINKCYEQALQIVQAQFAFRNENVVKTYDISVNSLYDNPVNLEFLNRLNTLLLCGQQDEVLEHLERIGRYYERNPYLYEFRKKQIFYSIWNVVYTVGLHLGCDDLSLNNPPVLTADMTCSGMIDIFKDCARLICGYMDQSRRSKNNKLKNRIVKYLQTHFEDAGLSAILVSGEMGISEKYLSQFIKEQTGETFSALLLNLRMEKAKEYLEQTVYSNDEIARLTGFGSANTFYRNFNKLMGVSPKVFRQKQVGAKSP